MRLMITLDQLKGAAQTPDHIGLHIYASMRHRWIYVMNLKAASTSMRELLLQTELGFRGETLPPVGIKRTMQTVFDGIHTLGGERLVEILNDPSFFKFTVARHPYTRTVSTFHKKSDKDAMRVRMQNLFAAYNIPFTWPMQFEAFLSFLEQYDPSPENLNRHWISQAKGTFSSVLKLDHIARLEKLSSDLERMATRLHIEPKALKKINQKKSNTPESILLTPSTKARIYALYKDDFEQFNYQP
jgi:hypothetical protein